MMPAGIDRPRMMLRLMASRSMAMFSASRTRLSLNGFLPLTLEYFSSLLPWSSAMKIVRTSGPSRTFSFLSVRSLCDVLRRQVGDHVDVARQQRRRRASESLLIGV